jgi:AraC-like DNA-binding protein
LVGLAIMQVGQTFSPVKVEPIEEGRGEVVAADGATHALLSLPVAVGALRVRGEEHIGPVRREYFLHRRIEWEVRPRRCSARSGTGILVRIPETLLTGHFGTHAALRKFTTFTGPEIPFVEPNASLAHRLDQLYAMIAEAAKSVMDNRGPIVQALLHSFFTYCASQCSLRSVVGETRTEARIVEQFRQLVEDRCGEMHEVTGYARELHVSPQYLAACVRSLLSVSPKQLIHAELLQRAQTAVRYSGQSLKEISFELGFSSPDYFSAFFRRQTGRSPSAYRREHWEG